MRTFLRRRRAELLFLLLAASIWWPTMHLFWRPQTGFNTGHLDPLAVPMAVSLEKMWSGVSAEGEELEPMRQINPEWDFMARTFFILGEANLALRVPDRKATSLRAMDALIEDTLAMESRHGMEYFLMDYYRNQPWVQQPPRSVFVDGEIALCLGARRLVEEHARWRTTFRERIAHLTDRMERGSVLCAESYPDECWIFCNTAALAALRMSEVLDGADHRELKNRWLESAKARLIDEKTGLLISTFQLDGTPHPAGSSPEGSSIWFAAHMLQTIDPAFAEEQYRLAKRHLGRSLLGFGYSREWPHSSVSGTDVDSGVVIPVFGVSASASGLALLASAAFQDAPYYRKLRTSLEIGAFPVRDPEDESLSFLLAGAIGDPVIFYSTVVGPLWERLTPATRQSE